MTDEELRSLVASNIEATRELRATVERQAQRAEAEGRTTAESLASLKEGSASLQASSESLQASSESQLKSIESMRESITYNTDMVASALALAAEALNISANTSRNLDRLENDIADLKQIVGIVIRDNQADRSRITNIEGQN